MSNKMKFSSTKSSSTSSLLTNHENLAQNGCKAKNVAVFTSVSRFGETKFKPIRKQENLSVQPTKPIAKRTRIEPSVASNSNSSTPNPNPSPVKRVNKFFKSRNGPTSSGGTSDESLKSKVSPSKRRMLTTDLRSIATPTSVVSSKQSVEEKPIRSNRGRLLKSDSSELLNFEKKAETLPTKHSRSLTPTTAANTSSSVRTSTRLSSDSLQSTTSAPQATSTHSRRTRANRHVSFDVENESSESTNTVNQSKFEANNSIDNSAPSNSNKKYSTRFSKARLSSDSTEIKPDVSAELAKSALPPVSMVKDEDITLNEEDLDHHLMRENLGEIDQLEELDPFEPSNSFIGRPSITTSSVTSVSPNQEKRDTRFKGKKHVQTSGWSNNLPVNSSVSKLAAKFNEDSDEELDFNPVQSQPKRSYSSRNKSATLDVIEVKPEQEVFLNDDELKAIEKQNPLPSSQIDLPIETNLESCTKKHKSDSNPIDLIDLPSTHDLDKNLSQTSEQFDLIESQKEFKSSSAVDTNAVPIESKPEVAPMPQKKRFFSRSNKDKKQTVQFNTKNFFTKPQDPDLEDEFALEESQASQEVKKETNDPTKEYDYLKVKRVRKAHQCAELGETEHFDGEIVFYLSGIKERNTLSMRCLSVLGLANQCLSKTELRMHLRAHDYMSKIISALMDAPKNPNLALCAAALMFIYNQDRLTMDIDPNALSLMLELLECTTQNDQIESRHMEKITEMCKIMKERGYGKYLKLNEITAGTLAMETLLSLTSKRAGDWFKEELRTLKGIDFLINTVLSVSESTDKQYMQEEAQLNKIDRSLRVIENVTFMNTDNQRYVIKYKDFCFIQRCAQLFEQCKHSIIFAESSSQSGSFLSPLLSILRVFTNLTSDSSEGCIQIGDNLPELFQLFLDSVFELPSFVVPDSRFDLIIFLLCLCVNLVEFCQPIREEFIENHSQLRRLVEMLVERVEEAQKTEKQADDFLDSQDTQQKLNSETINIDSILTDLLAKSGKHMEHTIIAACISLLIGCGMKDNSEAMQQVKQILPNTSFDIMIEVITKLKEFSSLASIMTESGIRRVDSILAVLKGTKKEAPVQAHLDASVSLMSIKDDDLSLDDDSQSKTDL